jgi:predicted AlkP superfamily pyrophosphatase or phosphodiesterase
MLAASFLLTGALRAESLPDPSTDNDIRLVLQITVDGLRADLLTRARAQAGTDGFNRLLDNGTWFTNAHYRHANTETIVGHSTLATGAQPSVHGMTGNVWYDAEDRELAYNIEDPESPILPVRNEQQTGDQVDPSQNLARSKGRSPRALLAETFADKLHVYSTGLARTFAVSGKDRGAVPLAGKAGTAYWMSTDSGDFVTSAWYMQDYPEWVAEWNRQRKANGWAGREWALLNDPSSYLMAERDDRPYETDLRGFGRTFPHRYGGSDNKLLYTQVIASPAGDALLADFAKNLIRNEDIGQGPAADFLSVSFSGVDAVNHFFGPASLETEDMVRQLDRILADLLAFVDSNVGLDQTVIVLSADHGAAEMPEYMAEHGYDASRLTSDKVTGLLEDISQEEFGQTGFIRFYYRPYVYLDHENILAAGLDPAQVRETFAQALTRQRGIQLAATRNMLEGWPDQKLLEQIHNNYHPARAGDICVVQDPYWFNFDKGPVAAMHGSPWNYDTHVPLLFVGPGITPQVVSRAVQPADVAPTLAALLHMTPPASSQGEVLVEVVNGDN